MANRPRLQSLKPRLKTIGSRLSTIQPGSWRTDKQSSTARGYGYKWQKARERYLVEHPFCAYCLRDAGIAATVAIDIAMACMDKGIPLPFAKVVDHIKPHQGDQSLFWDEDNWQPLCVTHHSAEKQRDEARQ